MEISNYRPARPGGNTRAYLDVRLDDGIFIRNLALVQTKNGIRVYGPEFAGQRIVTLPPAVADAIAEAVADAAA
ncbi:MAG: hypothetical protein WBA44_05090 [Mesorhizobium sp.]